MTHDGATPSDSAPVPDRLVVPGRDHGDGPRTVFPAFTTRVDIDEPTRRSEHARYLAALALGLGSAGWRHATVVEELVGAAGDCESVLLQASRLVYPMRIGDPDQRQRARCLLLEAANRIRASRAPAPPTSGSAAARSVTRRDGAP